MSNRVKRYIKLRKNTMLASADFDVQRLKKRLSTYEYVSFDIFDTLLKRDVQQPSDVFELIERTYNLQHPSNKIQGFRDKRILAESIARKKSKYEEVCLEDIYQNLMDYSEQVRGCLKEIEEKTEYELCVPHKPIFTLYQFCLDQNKKIYLVSDMYLSEDSIKKELTKCGISRYDAIYVSSSYRKTKRTGSLFDCLLEKEKINPNKLIHIGDSVHSDERIPREKGIMGISIPKNMVYDERCISKYQDTLNENILKSFINNRIDLRQDLFYQFGYDSFGMLLWGFSKWLLHELQEKEIQNVYFFSRDGWIMKQAFDIINHNETGIVSHYLEVSRRSLKVPLLWKDCTLEKVVQDLSAMSVIKISNLLDGMGLDVNQYKNVMEELDLKEDSFFYRDTILKNPSAITLFERIRTDAYESSKAEYKNVCRYLQECGIEGRFAIVDIGWSGGMQRNLIELLETMNIIADVSGFYMGITKYYKQQMKHKQMTMKGYVFDFAHDKFPIEKHRGFVGLFETFFLERDGSVMRYEYNEKSGRTEAKRYPYEFQQDDKLLPEVDKIRNLQKGAIDFVYDADKSKLLNNIQVLPKEVFENVRRCCGKPTQRELDMFSDIHFYDEKYTQYLAEPKRTALEYLFHFRQLKMDLYFSGWKIGFLRKLFGFNFPYYQTKQIISRIWKGK